ncbi:MAG TPA: hypothetical protein VGP43_10545 [Chitinophagaceae bacterium]|nr:hypothetical protein [Chitinophagaceae bacterium]
MKSSIIFCALLIAASSSFSQTKKTATPVKIKWVLSVKGDFSFVKKWSYPEGVEVNEFGQLSCNGFCPPETEAMFDSTGKIAKDSLTAFYKIVDTSHQSYSIDCKAWCYEWAGADFIEVVRKSVDTTYCYTLLNAATHCSLQLNIAGANCFAIIELNSVVKEGNARYYCRNGYITIDKNLWKKGIMKAIFSFNFENKENPKKPIYWYGKIFTKIKPG